MDEHLTIPKEGFDQRNASLSRRKLVPVY